MYKKQAGYYLEKAIAVTILQEAGNYINPFYKHTAVPIPTIHKIFIKADGFRFDIFHFI